MARQQVISEKQVSIEVVRRSLVDALPGSAEARHTYTRVFHTRAKVKSAGLNSEWAKVDIAGKRPTHTFTIRYTTIPFDARDRVRTVDGHLYQILNIDNVDLTNRAVRIVASNQGDESMEAAR